MSCTIRCARRPAPHYLAGHHPARGGTFYAAAALARVAAAHAVSIAGSAAFAVSVSPDDHIRIPFTAPDDVLAEGIRRLGGAWREYRETLGMPS